MTGTSDPPRSNEYAESLHSVKIKIRYLVEKKIDGEWVPMARLPENPERVEDLCWAFGGVIRVQDLVTLGIWIEERDFE